ncbi:MAG: glycosyltransferase family 39 protein [bacterium]
MFLFSNAVIIVSAYLLVRNILRDGDTLERFIGAVVLASVQIITILIILGTTVGINPLNVLVASLVILFAVSISCRAWSPHPAVFGAIRRSRPANWWDTGNALLFALAITGLCALFIFAAVTPPPPSDAFMDHLVFPAEWLKKGKIEIVQIIEAEQAPSYYPANAELLYLWLMLPVHDDIIARFLEVFFYFVCFVCSYGIGRGLGLGKWNAIGAASLAILTAGIFKRAVNCDVDITFTAFFLSALYFLLVSRDRKNFSCFILSGFGAGLCAGTKYIGAVFIFLLIPLLFYFSRRYADGRVKRAALPIIIWTACAAIAGGCWYLRNYITTGSASYPLGLSVGNFTIMQGAYTREAMYNSYLYIPFRDLGALIDILRGHLFGNVIFFIVCISVPAGFVFRASLSSFHRKGFDRVFTCCLPFIILFIYWFINPYNTFNNYRFLFPAVFLVYILIFKLFSHDKVATFLISTIFVFGSVYAISRDAEVINIFRVVICALSGSAGEVFILAAYGISMTATSFIIWAAIAFLSAKRKMLIGKYIAALISAVMFFNILMRKSSYLEEYRYSWYGSHYLGAGWSAVAKNIEQPVKIAYAGNTSPYGLYGSKLKNDVVYINTDGRGGWKFHNYERKFREKGGKITESTSVFHIFRGEKNSDAWYRLMKKEKVNYLFVTKQFYKGIVELPVEAEWALSHPDKFILRFQEGDTYIFKVK